MKIAIVGAGAMGCLYGAKLSAVPENEVYLLDIWKEHIDAINQKGITMEEEGNVFRFDKVKACSDANIIGICDVVIVFAKSIFTEEAVKNNLAVFGPDTVAITLQNGLGNIDIISAEIGLDNVIAGTTAHGATVLGAGKIRHAGIGKTVIGEINGDKSPRLESIAEMFEKAGFDTELSNNVVGLVWDKLLVNVGINALTAITGLQNGELLKHKEIEELLEAAVREGELVALTKGIELNCKDPVAHTKEVCIATAENKSSMLQDILNNRQTEIEMMNGAIVRDGALLSVKTPINMALTNIIKFTQKKNRND